MATLWLNFEHILKCVKGRKGSPKNTMDCAYRWEYFHKIMKRKNQTNQQEKCLRFKRVLRNLGGLKIFILGGEEVKL